MISTVLKLENEKINAHSNWVISVQFSPDGTKIVSGSEDKTIKVWDSGAFGASNHLTCAKTDVCLLAWQLRWISRLRRATQTLLSSCQCSSRPMGLRLCLEVTARSKSGIQVRFGPQIASLLLKLTPPASPHRFPESPG